MDELQEVTVIRHKGQSALVSYVEEGEECRVFVPLVTVSEEDGKSFVSTQNLQMGIPYGIPFDELLSESFTVRRGAVIRELKRAGIWTVADYERNPGQIQSIIVAVNSSLRAELKQIVKDQKRRI